MNFPGNKPINLEESLFVDLHCLYKNVSFIQIFKLISHLITERKRMEKFEIHILGCGSALPTLRHHPSSQVINLREKLFMIDCGEGTQLQFRKTRLKFSHLNTIFISHTHGDHCLGLMGLIQTFSMLGRTAPIHIYGPQDLKEFLQPQLDFYQRSISFPVNIHCVNSKKNELIYEDRSVEVYTIPLSHRVLCCGYLFKEKRVLPHIRRDMLDFYQIPNYAINSIKEGANWILPDGECVDNSKLTFPGEIPRSYAYCSDTCYLPNLAGVLTGIDLLYHEATFCEENVVRAQEVMHTTARQAAMLAKSAKVRKLMIGHFSARYENESILLQEAQQVFPRTILANEGLVINV